MIAKLRRLVLTATMLAIAAWVIILLILGLLAGCQVSFVPREERDWRIPTVYEVEPRELCVDDRGL